VVWFQEFREAVDVLQKRRDIERILIVGGAEIYSQALGVANVLHVTEMLVSLPDSVTDPVYFPTFDLSCFDKQEQFVRNRYVYYISV